MQNEKGESAGIVLPEAALTVIYRVLRLLVIQVNDLESRVYPSQEEKYLVSGTLKPEGMSNFTRSPFMISLGQVTVIQ